MTDKNSIQIAFLVPKEFAREFHPESADSPDARVERKLVDVKDEDRERLGFEPITTTSMLWLALKVIGKEAMKCAVGIVVKDLYRQWQEHQQEPHFITLRFSDGYSQQLDMTKPVTRAEVEELLRQHGLV